MKSDSATSTAVLLRRVRWITLAMLAVLGTLWAVHWLNRAAPPPMPGGQVLIGGPFDLVDQRGARMTDQMLRGRYMLVYFGFSFCPDICPTDLAAISQGLAAFESANPSAAAKVQPIFISLDPERDTPATLKTYAEAFHPRLLALTGSRPAIDAAIKAYRVVARKNVTSGDDANYLIDHSSNIYLMGPDGQFVDVLTPTPDALPKPDQVLAMLKAHVS
jgi:protein SCO1